MGKKYTLTPFARLFLFLMFFVPIGFFGYKIYNGEMTVQDLINKLKFESKADATSINNDDNETCQKLLDAKDKEIKELKEQLKQFETVSAKDK